MTTNKPVKRLIKKYPNRRLYDTETSTYVTLSDVKQLVFDQEDFKVVDAKSNEDLTRSILLHIIVEKESGSMPIFSSRILSQIIRCYGHAMQSLMGEYLEKNIEAFIDIQNTFTEQSNGGGGSNALTQQMGPRFMNRPAPMMQDMMARYIEQSKNLLVQIHEQMQNQAKAMSSGLPPASDGGTSSEGERQS